MKIIISRDVVQKLGVIMLNAFVTRGNEVESNGLVIAEVSNEQIFFM
jgi:hypothetical protein